MRLVKKFYCEGPLSTKSTMSSGQQVHWCWHDQLDCSYKKIGLNSILQYFVEVCLLKYKEVMVFLFKVGRNLPTICELSWPHVPQSGIVTLPLFCVAKWYCIHKSKVMQNAQKPEMDCYDVFVFIFCIVSDFIMFLIIFSCLRCLIIIIITKLLSCLQYWETWVQRHKYKWDYWW